MRLACGVNAAGLLSSFVGQGRRVHERGWPRLKTVGTSRPRPVFRIDWNRPWVVMEPGWRAGLRQASCLFLLTQAAWRFQEALAMTGYHLRALYHKCEL